MLQGKYGYTLAEAGSTCFLPYLISAFLCAPVGYMIDKVGMRAIFIMGSSVAVTLAMIITMLQPGSEDPANLIKDQSCLIPLVLLGVGYSIYACALWGSVPYTVEEHLLGSAFGLCTAVQNTGLTITPLILATLQGWSKTNT